MLDENGNEMSEKEVIKEMLDDLGRLLCFAYELKSDVGKSFAFMLDSTIKYGTTIYHDKDILDAAADYQRLEQEIYEEHKAIEEGKVVCLNGKK